MQELQCSFSHQTLLFLPAFAKASFLVFAPISLLIFFLASAFVILAPPLEIVQRGVVIAKYRALILVALKDVGLV